MREEIRFRIPTDVQRTIGRRRAVRMAWREVLGEAQRLGWTGAPQVRAEIDRMARELAVVEDQIAAVALALTEPEHRDQLTWIADPYNAVRHPRRIVAYPRAVACLWSAHPEGVD